MINTLVVGDSKEELEVFESLKTVEDISLYKLKCLNEAFSLLKIVKIDLILIDIYRLAKNDFTIIKELRETPKYKTIHICVLSNKNYDENLISLAYKNGVDDNLLKPLNMSKFRNKMKNIRDAKSLRADTIFCDVDIHSKFIFISDKFLELTLFSYDELIESSFIHRTGKMMGKKIINLLHQIPSGQKKFEIIKIYKKDGTICYLETTIFHLGEADIFRFIFHDITNKLYLNKKMKLALNAKNTITTFTDGKKLLDISDEFFKIFPFDNLEDFLSKHTCLCDLFIKKNDNTPHLMPMMGEITWIDYIQKNEDDFFNAYMIDKDGVERIYDVNIIEKLEFANNIKEYIIIFNDVTKVKELLTSKEISQLDFLKQANTLCEMQLKLEKSLENEQRLRKQKDKFFANMSHEIRTPLGGVVSSLELLQNTNLSESQQEYVNICINSSNHLLALVEDILDMNKIKSDKFVLNYEECDLIKEIESLYKLFNLQANQKNLYLKFILDENIPHYISCDTKRLRQILINLISNSLKFTSHGGVTLKISVMEYYKKDIRLLFEVTDTGKGIDEIKLNNIFDPFSQESSDTYTRFGGTGLGTSIVKQLINEFGGRIDISSKLNVGTTVSCEIPFKVIPKTKVIEEKKETHYYKFNGEYVLIAEDNITNQTLVKSILKQFNLNCVITNNGDEVVKEYIKNSDKYPIILMDINMPSKNGFIATMDIRKYEKHNLPKIVPIVALTANIMIEDREKLSDIGINDYLTKPINKKLLNTILKRYIKPVKEEEDSFEEKKEEEGKKENSKYSFEEVSEYFGISVQDLKDILKDFFSDFDSQIQTAKELIKSKNFHSLQLTLHSMKGSSAELKLIKLNEEIKIQESLCKKNQEVNLENIIKIKNLLQKELNI